MDVRVDNVLRERWDDVARVYTAWDASGVQTLTRPYTTEENARADAAAAMAIAAANAEQISNVTELQGRLSRLAAYKTDPDLLAVTANNNNTALPTATLNRALKTLVRQNERQSATIAVLVRLIDPELLADIADTVE